MKRLLFLLITLSSLAQAQTIRPRAEWTIPQHVKDTSSVLYLPIQYLTRGDSILAYIERVKVGDLFGVAQVVRGMGNGKSTDASIYSAIAAVSKGKDTLMSAVYTYADGTVKISTNGLERMRVNLTGETHFQSTVEMDLANLLMGDNRIVSLAEPIDPHDATTKHYVDSRIGIEYELFFTNVASDIGGIYYESTPTDPITSETTLTKSNLTGTAQAVYNFASPTGGTGLTTLMLGEYTVHLDVEKTAGQKDLALYCEIWTRTSGGTETLRVTTATSSAITGRTSLHLLGNLGASVTINATDRYVVKVLADVTGGGNNVTVALYQEGHTDAHLSSPSNTTILSDSFVRRDGGFPATSDGAALGSTSLQWSDLFLASGGVVNFGNGNYTATHSTGLLTLSGNLKVGNQALIGLDREIVVGGSGNAGLSIVGNSGTQKYFIGSITTDYDFAIKNVNTDIYILRFNAADNATFAGNLTVNGTGTSLFAGNITTRSGTATAGTSPLKIPSGTVLGTPEAGAIESDGTHLYWTTNGGVRDTLDLGGLTPGQVGTAGGWTRTDKVKLSAAGDYVYITVSAGDTTTTYNFNNAGTSLFTGAVVTGSTLTMGGNILLSGKYLSNDGGNEGISVDNSGNVTSSGNLIVSGTGTSSFAGNVKVGTEAFTGLDREIVIGGSGNAGLSIVGNSGTQKYFIGSITTDYDFAIKNVNTDIYILRFNAADNATFAGNLTVSGTGQSSVAGVFLLNKPESNTPGTTGLMGYDNWWGFRTVTSNHSFSLDTYNTGGAYQSSLGVSRDGVLAVNGTGTHTFAGTIAPASSDGSALGTTSLMWSDLFLASGAVINFNNGNYTLTHSAGLLTFSGNINAGTIGGTTTFSGSGGVNTAGDVLAAGYVRSTGAAGLLTGSTTQIGILTLYNGGGVAYVTIQPGAANGVVALTLPAVTGTLALADGSNATGTWTVPINTSGNVLAAGYVRASGAAGLLAGATTQAGYLTLYRGGSQAGYTIIQPGSASASLYTLTLPNANGTLALTDGSNASGTWTVPINTAGDILAAGYVRATGSAGLLAGGTSQTGYLTLYHGAAGTGYTLFQPGTTASVVVALTLPSVSGTVATLNGGQTWAATTVQTNLNADLLDGNHAAAFATSGQITWGAKTGSPFGYISSDGTWDGAILVYTRTLNGVTVLTTD